MNFVLKSKKTGLYFKRGEWFKTPIEGTLYKSYNPIRFVMKWFISLKYEAVDFHGVLLLQAKIKVLEKLKTK